MIFPFEITFKKKLKGEILKYSTSEILMYLKLEFEKSGTDYIELLNDCILIKNDWISLRIRPGWNWNRWLGINSAKFQIKMIENNERKAIYTFDLTKLLFISTIVSFLFGSISRSFLIGLITFLFIGFMNWVIKLIQHKISFDELLSQRNYHLSQTQKHIVRHPRKNRQPF
jgi:hypothetical protein